MSFARALYSAITWGAQPLLRRKLRRRARAEPGYAVAVPERFGRYAQPVAALQKPTHRVRLPTKNGASSAIFLFDKIKKELGMSNSHQRSERSQ